MKQEDIKFIYKIDSTLDLEDLLNALKEELNLTEGIFEYWDGAKDDNVQEKLEINKLIARVLDYEDEDSPIAIIFPKVEIFMDQETLEVTSKIKLKLRDVDITKVEEK